MKKKLKTSPGFRLSVRPTIAVQRFEPKRIQEVVIGIFRLNGYVSMDFEALIFFTLKHFDVTAANYKEMQPSVRNHIISNFAIDQGSYIPNVERGARRLTVCYTIERDEE